MPTKPHASARCSVVVPPWVSSAMFVPPLCACASWCDARFHAAVVGCLHEFAVFRAGPVSTQPPDPVRRRLALRRPIGTSASPRRNLMRLQQNSDGPWISLRFPSARRPKFCQPSPPTRTKSPPATSLPSPVEAGCIVKQGVFVRSCCAAVPHSFIRIRHELALRLALAATFCLLLRKDQFFFRAHEHLIQRILQKLHDLLQKVHVQSQSNARKLKFQRGTTPAF